MGIQQVENHIIILLHVHGIAAVHHILKFILLCCLIQEKIMDPAGQRIVHHRIVFISPQPLTGIMPDFAQQIEIRLHALQLSPELLQETVGHLISHVEPDAVDVEFPDPSLTDLAEISDYFRIVGIQLRHPVRKGKGIESPVPGIPMPLKGIPVLYHEPVGIGGSALFLHHVRPWAKAPAAVVEDGIHHDADSMGMGFLYQPGKLLIGAKLRVDLRVIPCIVFVGGLRFHNRVQVNTRYPQVM